MASYGYKGWIKLWREEMHNPMYFEEPFTKWQAWIDLCMMADDDQTIKTSLEALKNRWSWGSTWRVNKLLQTLSQMDCLTVHQTRNKGTIIRINTDFSKSEKSKKQIRRQTEHQTDCQTEEVTSKEVEGTKSPSYSTSAQRIEEYKRLNLEDDDSNE